MNTCEDEKPEPKHIVRLDQFCVFKDDKELKTIEAITLKSQASTGICIKIKIVNDKIQVSTEKLVKYILKFLENLKLHEIKGNIVTHALSLIKRGIQQLETYHDPQTGDKIIALDSIRRYVLRYVNHLLVMILIRFSKH